MIILNLKVHEFILFNINFFFSINELTLRMFQTLETFETLETLETLVKE